MTRFYHESPSPATSGGTAAGFPWNFAVRALTLAGTVFMLVVLGITTYVKLIM